MEIATWQPMVSDGIYSGASYIFEIKKNQATQTLASSTSYASCSCDLHLSGLYHCPFDSFRILCCFNSIAARRSQQVSYPSEQQPSREGNLDISRYRTWKASPVVCLRDIVKFLT